MNLTNGSESPADGNVGGGDAVAPWAAVMSLAVGAFSLVASEMLPVGMVGKIAIGLNTTEGKAAVLMTVPGIAAAVAAPLIVKGLGRIDRKHLLLWMTMALVLSNLLLAVSSVLWVAMVGRLLLGVALGGFWSIAGALGPRLRPGKDAVRASAMIASGISLGIVAGDPAGAYAANPLGWRYGFYAASGLTMLTLIGIKRDLLNAHSEVGRRSLERISNAANYYEYDLRFETTAGTKVLYSQWGTGSGGESGTPPYILCGMLVAHAFGWFKGKGPRMRVLMLDEAFKVHDLERSNRVIQYLRSMGFQLIIAAQMDKASSILPNFTTTVSVARLSAKIGGTISWVSQIHVIGLKSEPLRTLWQKRRNEVAAAAEAEFRRLHPPPEDEVDVEEQV